MGPSLARRIERALNEIERGSTLTAAMWSGLSLDHSPRHSSDGPRRVDWRARAELESALRAVQRLRAGPHPRPRPEFRAAARERIVAAARTSGRPAVTARRSRRSLIRRFLPFAAALALVGSGVVASFVAIPIGTVFADALGPALYVVEQVQLAAVPDDDSRARLSLTIAERRRAELESAATAGQFDRAASIAARYTASLATASRSGTISGQESALAASVADESERGAAAIARAAESAPSPIAQRLRSLAVASPTPTTSPTFAASATVAGTATAHAAPSPSAGVSGTGGGAVAAAPSAEPTRRIPSRDNEPDDPRFGIASRAAELASLALIEVGKPAVSPAPSPTLTTELASSRSPAESPWQAERRAEIAATATASNSSQRGNRPSEAVPTVGGRDVDPPVVVVPKAKAPKAVVPQVVIPTAAIPTPRAARPAAAPTPRPQPSPTAKTTSKSAPNTIEEIEDWLRRFGR